VATEKRENQRVVAKRGEGNQKKKKMALNARFRIEESLLRFEEVGVGKKRKGADGKGRGKEREGVVANVGEFKWLKKNGRDPHLAKEESNPRRFHAKKAEKKSNGGHVAERRERGRKHICGRV